MPEEGVSLKEHQEIMSFEDIEKVVGVGAGLGIRKIRLTGGEPLIRRNLPDLVASISRIDSIDDVAITTNGVLFAAVAARLKAAGLNRVNISLDTLRSDRYDHITRGGDIKAALVGVEKALEEDLHPVKINTVLIKGFNEDEILDFCRMAYEMPLHIRFIEFMPVGEVKYWDHGLIVENAAILQMIAKHFSLKPGKVSRGNGPAKYFELEGGQGSVGFISPMSNHFCGECNRLRLTADGRLRACLYDGQERNLRQALQSAHPEEEIRRILMETILSKPERHALGDKAWGARDRKMYQIGG
jgi:cyclic pyranopterin phosphate synthase